MSIVNTCIFILFLVGVSPAARKHSVDEGIVIVAGRLEEEHGNRKEKKGSCTTNKDNLSNPAKI